MIRDRLGIGIIIESRDSLVKFYYVYLGLLIVIRSRAYVIKNLKWTLNFLAFGAFSKFQWWSTLNLLHTPIKEPLDMRNDNSTTHIYIYGWCIPYGETI